MIGATDPLDFPWLQEELVERIEQARADGIRRPCFWIEDGKEDVLTLEDALGRLELRACKWPTATERMIGLALGATKAEFVVLQADAKHYRVYPFKSQSLQVWPPCGFRINRFRQGEN